MRQFIAPAPEGYTLVPIAIRENDVAHVRFPSDLTKAEAEKIARVVLAYGAEVESVVSGRGR